MLPSGLAVFKRRVSGGAMLADEHKKEPLRGGEAERVWIAGLDDDPFTHKQYASASGEPERAEPAIG